MSNDTFVSGVGYPHPFAELAVELCASASRSVCILSPELDQEVFDSQELAEALSRLARDSRQTDIRILVQHVGKMVGKGHRLLQLSRRIPSKVRIQRLSEHPDWNRETLLIRDFNGVLYKPGGSDHEGFYEPDSRSSTQGHLEHFEELWRYSVQDPELRSLPL